MRIDGELHELPRVFASPGDEISIALRAVKKLIRKPRDIGRAVSAASIDGMWENSKIEAMGEDVRRDDREMAPVDLVKIIRHNARLLRVRRLLEALQQSYDDAIARGGSGPLLGIRKATHLLHRGTMTIPGYRWAMREPLTPGLDNVPVVVLDATAEPDIVERWLGKTNQIRDPAPRKMNPNVLVRQIVDAQIGYTAVNKAKWISRLRAFIWAAALQHWNEARGPYDVAVVLPKSVLKKIGMLPSRVVAITWGSESGLNVAEHVVRGIVISRKLPSSGDVSFASEITFGMPVEDKDYTFKRADRLVRGDDGRSYSYEGGRGRGLAVSRHPDPHAEIIRRQWCDGSFEQGLGRFRIHRRTEETPLLLDIITNHPSAEVAVDQLLTLASFKREIDAVELRLMAAGVTLRSGTYGAASIGALVSGKLSELLRREMDNTLTNIDNFKTEHADALEKCRKRVLRMAIDSQAKARKRQENRESGENAESGILPIRTVYNNNRGSPTFSSGWTLPQMDRGAGTKAAAVLQITPGTRPMKVQIRLDPAEGCDREFALERIQNFSGAFPIHSIVYDDATFPRLIDGKVERGPTTHESE